MKSLFVRVDPEFHKRVKVEAARRGVSVQAMVERLLARELELPLQRLSPRHEPRIS